MTSSFCLSIQHLWWRFFLSTKTNRCTTRKSKEKNILWIVSFTSLITFAILFVQIQVAWKPSFLEQHKFWDYNLEKEEPLQTDQKCFLPRIHPFDPSILRYLTPSKSIKCKERQFSLTYIDDKGVLRFNETSVKLGEYDPSTLKCYFQELKRKSDFDVEYGDKIRIPVNGSHINSDFVYVSCDDFSGIAFYTNIHCHIVPKNKLHVSKSEKKSDHLPYNVLIIGIDSLSRLSFIRNLPETYEFLTKTLKAFVFRGMTKVGDNTFPNLIAMLTGKSVFNDELPKVQKLTGTYDEWPCLWKNFSKASYATLFAEDQPKIGLFNYLRGGLKTPPTDHYLSTFWLAVQSSKLHLLSSSLCFGNTPKHLIQLNYTRAFVQKYNKNKTPFFAFTFFVELSHDYVKVVSAADQDFKAWLSDLYNSGYLNNTFLFFLSDHGHRFDPMRATLIGRIEERMPLFSMVVPPSLYRTHPKVIESLKLNVKRLTTPYDIHFTAMDILSHSTNRKPLGNTSSPRGTTLFAPITSERTCQTAGIPDHYCVCETEEALDVSDSRSKKAAAVLLSTINNLVQFTHGNFCYVLSVIQIVRSDLIIAPQKVIVNSRMYFGKLKEDSRAKGMFGKLRIIIKTAPGNALFEATLQYREDEDSYSVLGDISRINPYGSQSDCIDEAVVKKYCYCKNVTDVNS